MALVWTVFFDWARDQASDMATAVIGFALPSLAQCKAIEDDGGENQAITCVSSNAPSFFDLPYDIRYLIYSMVLQPKFPLRRWEHYMTCPGCNLDITGTSIAKCSSLLFVNRQVYEEASPILHNIEHVVKIEQGASNGLWRQSALNHHRRPRRSGGVEKLAELEARRLRRIILDVTFKDASLKTKSTLQTSWNDSSVEWGQLYEPGSAVDSKTPVREEAILKEQVKDLVRVLTSGGAIRKVVIRLRNWPSWDVFTSAIDESSREVCACSKDDMLDVFRPLLEFDIDDQAVVDITAVSAGRSEGGDPIVDFVKLFNEKRAWHSESRLQDRASQCKDRYSSVGVNMEYQGRAWRLAAECRKCDQVFAEACELKEHVLSAHP